MTPLGRNHCDQAELVCAYALQALLPSDVRRSRRTLFVLAMSGGA